MLSLAHPRWQVVFGFECRLRHSLSKLRHTYGAATASWRNRRHDRRPVMVDPYPGMALEYALKALYIRFGNGNVKHMSGSRQVTVPLAYPGDGTLIPVVLTVEQAKYLAVNPTDLKDLVEGRPPVGWPK